MVKTTMHKGYAFVCVCVYDQGVELMKKALEKSNIKLDYTENFDSDPRQAVRSMKVRPETIRCTLKLSDI